MRKIIKIKQDNDELRTIGVLEDGSLTCPRLKSKHLYRKINAWGIDAEVFNDLYNKELLNTLIVEDKEELIRYKVKAEVVEKRGKYLHFKPHRPQIFLPLKHWEKEE